MVGSFVLAIHLLAILLKLIVLGTFFKISGLHEGFFYNLGTVHIYCNYVHGVYIYFVFPNIIDLLFCRCVIFVQQQFEMSHFCRVNWCQTVKVELCSMFYLPYQGIFVC